MSKRGDVLTREESPSLAWVDQKRRSSSRAMVVYHGQERDRPTYDRVDYGSAPRPTTQEDRRSVSPAHSTAGIQVINVPRQPEGGEETLNENDLDLDVPHHAFYDPNDPADITVHLDLPVSKDLGDDLEKLDQLKRMGDFKAACSFFDEALYGHIDHPYVFIQYADMLVEMGDHTSFGALDQEPVLGAESNPGDNKMVLLGWVWTLLEALSLIRRDPSFHSIRFAEKTAAEALEYLDIRHVSDLPFTELRIVTLTLRLFAALKDSVPEGVSAPEPLVGWVDWEGLCESLLQEHRDWDFRDLVVSGATAFGQEKFAEMISRVVNFNIPWDQFAADESASLAHLDLLVSLLQVANQVTDSRRMEKDRVDAKALAEIIMHHHPGAMRSQAFANWLLVEAAMAGRQRASKGGRRLGGDLLLALPVRIPEDRSKIPDWEYIDVAPSANEPVQAALALAREMGNYNTEAACLRLLALRSQEQAPLLQELSRLQEELGDRHGQLESCMARYYGCHDLAAQEKLLDDVRAFEHFAESGGPDHRGWTFLPLLQQARHGIEDSLKFSLASGRKPDNPPEHKSAGERRGKRASGPRRVPLHAEDWAELAPPFPLIRPHYGPRPGEVTGTTSTQVRSRLVPGLQKAKVSEPAPAPEPESEPEPSSENRVEPSMDLIRVPGRRYMSGSPVSRAPIPDKRTRFEGEWEQEQNNEKSPSRRHSSHNPWRRASVSYKEDDRYEQAPEDKGARGSGEPNNFIINIHNHGRGGPGGDKPSPREHTRRSTTFDNAPDGLAGEPEAKVNSRAFKEAKYRGKTFKTDYGDLANWRAGKANRSPKRPRDEQTKPTPAPPARDRIQSHARGTNNVPETVRKEQATHPLQREAAAATTDAASPTPVISPHTAPPLPWSSRQTRAAVGENGRPRSEEEKETIRQHNYAINSRGRTPVSQNHLEAGGSHNKPSGDGQPI